MKEEKIFRYEGSKEQFSEIHQELAKLGLDVRYAESLCNDKVTIGFIQRKSEEMTLDSIIEANPDLFFAKGIIIEDSLARYKC